MPRYFFDTYDGDQLVPNTVGLELPDLEAGKAEAQKAPQDLARDTRPNGNPRTFMVSVKEEIGELRTRAALTLTVEDVGTAAATKFRRSASIELEILQLVLRICLQDRINCWWACQCPRICSRLQSKF
jgi:hypothetical protein